MSAAATNPRRVWNVIQSPVIHTGIFAGVLLVGVMLASLIAATRMPQFDSIAALRNLVCFGAFGLVMTIPVARYFGSPWRLFTAGITAWSIPVSYTHLDVYKRQGANRGTARTYPARECSAIFCRSSRARL